eukprot:GFUD01103680.1.p1 GENE.GFUD01103680.1~~GFUD01103680.1.p1  ORF type:complete len:101 (-),score=45.58 GFUD01103680.1:73-375(-)
MGLFGGTVEGSSSGDSYSGSKLRSYGGGETDSFSSGQQKLQFMNQVHKLNETCWDLCVGNPSSSLSGREETCLNNCVDRFIDTTLLITNRFAQLAQKMGR